MFRFLIIIEKVGYNYSAYAPDLPGCVATGDTREETEENMYAAIEMHVQGLIEDQAAIPAPQASAEYVVFKSPAQLSEE